VQAGINMGEMSKTSVRTRQNSHSWSVELDLLRSVSLGIWNQDYTDCPDTDTNDSNKPEYPFPSSVLNQQGPNQNTEDIADGSSGAKKGKGTCLGGGFGKELDDHGECGWNCECAADTTESSEDD
jgi:hypothetical protein